MSNILQEGLFCSSSFQTGIFDHLPSLTRLLFAAAPSAPAVETVIKETKKLTVSGGDEDVHETDAQREARVKEIKNSLEELNRIDPREHLNIVFIGHVDAGKSTTAGQILFLTGGVDDRTIEKYEREAKEKNRESWYMAYIMDTNEEERAMVGLNNKGWLLVLCRFLFL